MAKLGGASKWWKNFYLFLINYLEHSSLHGVWHLTRIKRNHFIERWMQLNFHVSIKLDSSYRIFWVIVLISIVLFAVSNISSVWMRFLYNPTVITIDRDYLNRNLTFPPLTLCLRERLNQTAMEKFLVELNKSQKMDLMGMRNFLKNLANFNINTLSSLINAKRNYFNVEDYVNVKVYFIDKRNFRLLIYF